MIDCLWESDTHRLSADITINKMEETINTNPQNPQRYSDSLLNQIFSYDTLVDRAEILHGWAILVDGKFYTHAGKFLFSSRKQALQTFYNGVRWLACRKLWEAEGHGDMSWPPDHESSRLWRTFKRNLERNHGFQVVYI